MNIKRIKHLALLLEQETNKKVVLKEAKLTQSTTVYFLYKEWSSDMGASEEGEQKTTLNDLTMDWLLENDNSHFAYELSKIAGKNEKNENILLQKVKKVLLTGKVITFTFTDGGVTCMSTNLSALKKEFYEACRNFVKGQWCYDLDAIKNGTALGDWEGDSNYDEDSDYDEDF